MQDLKDLVDLLIFFLVGVAGGIISELAARRRIWFPWALAILIGFAGALLGSWLINDFLGLLNDPAILDVSIIPVLIGTILLLIPWWLLRSGRTPYGKNRKWRTKYWRK